MTTDRAASLAAEFERVAADLRDGEATLYGYDVRRDRTDRERGGIAYDGGWLTFEIEHPGGWFDRADG
ncbi:MAG: hypothetical protein ABEJ31_07630 [Haloarculaceae archaeon]